jgi:uncharacterized membrane protein
MANPKDFRPIAYLIVLLGVSGSAVAAVVPFFTAGYELNTDVFLMLLGPFILYGMLSESLRGGWLWLPGLVLVAVSVAVVIPQRYLHYDDFQHDGILWLPLLVAVVLLPIAYFASKRHAEPQSGT